MFRFSDLKDRENLFGPEPEEVLPQHELKENLQNSSVSSGDSAIMSRMTISSALADKAFQAAQTPDGGATIGLAGNEPTSGYVYSPHPGWESQVPVSQLTTQMIDEYVESHRSQLSTPGRWFGIWHKPQTNIVFLDVAEVGPATPETLQLAAQAEQDSVYDVANNKILPTGYKGKQGDSQQQAQEGQSIQQQGFQQQGGYRESTNGFNSSPAPCPNCGKLKTRPSANCERCGHSEMENPHPTEEEASAYDMDKNWAPREFSEAELRRMGNPPATSPYWDSSNETHRTRAPKNQSALDKDFDDAGLSW